jgi:hypothetical protein
LPDAPVAPAFTSTIATDLKVLHCSRNIRVGEDFDIRILAKYLMRFERVARGP